MRKESNFLRFLLKKVKWNAFKALNKSYFYVCGLSECWPLGVSSRQSFCAIIIVVSMTRLGYFLKAIVSFHSNKSSPNIEQPFWTISKSISFNEKTVMATFWASLGKFGQVLFYLYHLVTLFVVKILTISRKLFDDFLHLERILWDENWWRRATWSKDIQPNAASVFKTLRLWTFTYYSWALLAGHRHDKFSLKISSNTWWRIGLCWKISLKYNFWKIWATL